MTEPIASARRILGKGLALVATDPGDDIGLDIAFVGGDLACAIGEDALMQDLRVAFCTGLGTDPLNTGFGSDAFAAMAQETDTIVQRERIRVAVIRVLRSDPRVRRVVEVRINGEPRPFAAERTTALAITAVFETALRDFATIAIEGMPDAG